MSDRCYIGTRKGLFVVERLDGGWDVTSSHFMGAQVPMLLPTGDQTVYAALKHGHFGAKMHRSRDGGAVWEEMMVPAFPPQPDDAPEVLEPMRAVSDEDRYPAGGKQVVTRTRDGGESFEQLTAGLPQQHAYDLVFRHGMDISADGKSLIVGSTTGGLWISEDSGESWGTVSEHLPPIYCVRFV